MDLKCFFLSFVCYAFQCVCLYVPCGHLLGKGWALSSRLWCLTASLSLSRWYPGSGVVLDCIDSWSLHPCLLCCTYLYVHSSFAIILMGKRELVALLCLSSWCLVIVVWLFLAVPWVGLQFVIVVFPDHTHYFCCKMQQNDAQRNTNLYSLCINLRY